MERNEEVEVEKTSTKKAPRVITVYGAEKAHLDKVAFFEKSDFHPEGEAYVVNNGEAVQVAETAAVKRAIGEGKLTTEAVTFKSALKKQFARSAARGATRNASAPPLRPATDSEEDRAGLRTPTEKETARVPEVGNGGLRKGTRP